MEAIDFSVKMHSGVMRQLEKNGLVETIEQNLQELHSKIPEDVTHVKIVSYNGRRSIYVPYKAEGGLEGYKYIGCDKKPQVEVYQQGEGHPQVEVYPRVEVYQQGGVHQQIEDTQTV